MALSDNVAIISFPPETFPWLSIDPQCPSKLLFRLTGAYIQYCLHFFACSIFFNHLWFMSSTLNLPSLKRWNDFWHIRTKKATLSEHDVLQAQNFAFSTRCKHTCWQGKEIKSTALDSWPMGLSDAVLWHVRFESVTKILLSIGNAFVRVLSVPALFDQKLRGIIIYRPTLFAWPLGCTDQQALLERPLHRKHSLVKCPM